MTFFFPCRIISDKERPFPQQLNSYQDRGAISRSTAAESLNRLRHCRKGAVAEVCRMVECRHAGHVGKDLTGCHGKCLPWSASFVPWDTMLCRKPSSLKRSGFIGAVMCHIPQPGPAISAGQALRLGPKRLLRPFLFLVLVRSSKRRFLKWVEEPFSVYFAVGHCPMHRGVYRGIFHHAQCAAWNQPLLRVGLGALSPRHGPSCSLSSPKRSIPPCLSASCSAAASLRDEIHSHPRTRLFCKTA